MMSLFQNPKLEQLLILNPCLLRGEGFLFLKGELFGSDL
jgi:hypothetical protein